MTIDDKVIEAVIQLKQFYNTDQLIDYFNLMREWNLQMDQGFLFLYGQTWANYYATENVPKIFDIAEMYWKHEQVYGRYREYENYEI